MEAEHQTATLEKTVLDIACFAFPQNGQELSVSTRAKACYRHSGATERHVWIEWKSYEPSSYDADQPPDARIALRVQQLAALLRQDNKPREFRVPHCLGYIYDRGHLNREGYPCFGFVFEKPEKVTTSAKPVSLLEVILGRSIGKSPPSLTDRVALASKLANCILYLHSVNWLHKGLRSHNIVFYCDRSDPDYKEPYLSGFDYARPARSGEMTEQPPENAEYDIYRHPRVHGDGPKDGFKKSFDIYSLGVILMEIACWESIDSILGIVDLSRAPPKVTKSVRTKLLGERKYIDKVRSMVGNTYADVVQACLTGATAFGITDDSDETQDAIAARLQAGFYDKVVVHLNMMKL